MRARLDLATRRLNQAQKLEKLWQDVMTQRNRADAEDKASRSLGGDRSSAGGAAAGRRKREAGRAAKFSGRSSPAIETYPGRRGGSGGQARELETQAAHVKKVADLTDSIGLLLEKQRKSLPDLRLHRKNVAAQ